MSVERALLVEIALAALLAGAALLVARRRRRREVDAAEQRATVRTLAFATSTPGTLRGGLTAESAAQVLPEVCSQARCAAVALYTDEGLLAFHPGPVGPADTHRLHVAGDTAAVVDAIHGERLLLLSVHPADHPCGLRDAAVAPLVVGDRAVAALVTYHARPPGPADLRITSDLAEVLATQMRLSQADRQRADLARSELRALQAQISPHFVYNTLTTIASFIRTDPDRARELITEFADFTRRAFRGPQAEFASLADELAYVHQYLLFEQARFGERLSVRYHVEPEVLGTVVPTLVVQPLVENAVKHGIESHEGRGTVVISAEAHDSECWVAVVDDGSGFDPRTATEADGALSNIDRRLREVFGPDHGLLVDSAPGTGTTVRMRIPRRRGTRLS